MKMAFVNDSCERLGVEYISAVLKQAGHETKLFVDPQLFDDEFITVKWLSHRFDYKEHLIRDLKEYKPDLIGISVVTGFYQWACTMARMIKEEMDVPIIFGGIHPTSVPERVIKNDFVDMVCVGEGEYPMLELVNSIQKGSIDYSIKNIWFKHNGNIIQNEIRELLDNLDSLPFADHDIYYDLSKFFKASYNLSTSRGCPYACTYCSHSYLHELYRGKGRYVRQRSVYNVISELLEAKRKYGFNLVVFMDDCFGMDIHWLKDFSQEYKKNIGVQYICTMHPQHIYPESASILKKSGCCQVTLGIQSFDESIRKGLMSRDMSNEALFKAMNTIQDESINLLVDNIYGFPGQDEESLIHLASFYTHRKPKRIFFYKLKYFPNTIIMKKAQESNELSVFASQEILDGKIEGGLSLDSFMRSRKNGSKIYPRLQFFFFLLDILPGRMTRYIIKNRLYRYYPSFLNPALFVAMRTIFASDIDTRLLRSRIIPRYISFMRKRLCQA